MVAMNDVIIPFKGDIIPGDTMGINLYIQATKEIDN